MWLPITLGESLGRGHFYLAETRTFLLCVDIARSFSLGQCAALPASRPRWMLRGEIPRSHAVAGHSRSLTAPKSPWQNPCVERLIGSIRRECLDHVIVLNESGLHHTLKSCFQYYERTRTHLSLEKDAPIPRRVQLPELGPVVDLPEVGGLHHRYERRAA